MHYAPLPQRGIIRLCGTETLSFLQGLVSNDVLHLAQRGIVYAALLTPQGKFLHDFFLMYSAGDVLIDCEKPRLTDLQKRLNMYRLRSDVRIEALADNHGITGVWGTKTFPVTPDGLLSFQDPRLPELGWRIEGDIAEVTAWCEAQGMDAATDEDYDYMRLRAGVPDGSRDIAIEKATLLPFGFEALHGVDFKKGCYVGQEVTARTKHIGQRKKQLFKIRAIKGNLPAPGALIYFGAEEAGELCSHRDGLGLALLKLDMAGQAQALQADFRCGDAIVHAELPGWEK